MTKRGKICNCISFYNDENRPLNFEGLENLLNELLKIISFIPNYMGVIGKGYPGEIRPIQRLKKKIIDKKFLGVESISYYACPVDSASPTYDWYAYVAYGNSFSGQELYIFIDDSLIDFNSQIFYELIKSASLIDKFKYGIGYQREFSRGPEYYAMGICYDIPLDSPECNSIGKWKKDRLNYRKYTSDHLRDIYTYNILNSNHLNIPINSASLKSHISRNNIGDFKPISDDLFIWKVSHEEIKIMKTLMLSNLISAEF